MKKLILLCCLVPAMCIADVSVNLDDEKVYADLEMTNYSRNKSKAQFKKAIEKALEKSLQDLGKDNLAVELTFTEVDMAGYMDYFSKMGMYGGMRIIKRNDTTKLDFEYVIKQDGKVLKSGSESLKELGIQRGPKDRGRDAQKPLYFEKRLLKDWLAEQV